MGSWGAHEILRPPQGGGQAAASWGREQWRGLGADTSFALRIADRGGAWPAAQAAGGAASDAEARATAAKREKSCLRMSSVDGFAQRARVFVSRPQPL